MKYESPIKINYQEGIPEFRTFREEINEKIECRIIASVQEKMAIEIDKEELIKALQYDRKQYEKGWQDARKAFQRPKGEWIEGTVELSVFNEPLPFMCPFCNGRACCKGNFCPNCGADMRGETGNGS